MKTKTKTQPLTINNQTIPGSFFGKLCKLYGVDGAHRILFKARNAHSIVKYCSKGIKYGWLAALSTEQEYDKQAQTDWIDETFLKIKPEPKRTKSNEGVMKDGKMIRNLPGDIGNILNEMGII